MEKSVYNPRKGRIETVDLEFTDDNTTWFSNFRNARDISMITDLDGVSSSANSVIRIHSGSMAYRGLISVMTGKRQDN